MTSYDPYPPLRRPRTLVRAARFALEDFRRERHTKRLLKLTRLPSSARLLPQLAELEAGLETMRKDGDASYSVSRHIIALAALMTEISLMKLPNSAPETKGAALTHANATPVETIVKFRQIR